MKNVTNEHAHEQAVRRALQKQGYILRKSRVRTPSLDDQGGYRIIDLYNTIVAGERFDLTLDEVEAWSVEENGDGE